MAFNSYTFFIFFGVVMALYYSPLNWQWRKINLLIASYIFYAAWHPPFVVLLLICTLADWFAGKGIDASEKKGVRRIFLLLSLLINLGMLCFFKYATFFMGNFIWLLSLIHVHYQPLKLDIVLPLGISFFTFQSLTYTFDIYRRKARPWPSFLDVALFVSFFPKLVIGPITRAFDFLVQCKVPVKADAKKMAMGFFLLLLGLFEKIVMADSVLAPVADQLFNKSGVPSIVAAWTGTLAFTGQIFFDFAGYSTCAIGIALCLGFTLPQNFKYPYAAVGFSDFWRRWHITLSGWLRDYLYISLGGNRRGAIRTNVNLMLTMLIGGLWHGASWTFIAWGGLHGLYLVIERLLKNIIPSAQMWSKRPMQVIFAFATFMAVSIAWIFFRADTFEQAFTICRALVASIPEGPTIRIESFYVLLTGGAMLIVLLSHWIMRDRSLENIVDRMTWWQRSVVFAVMIFIIVTCSGDDRAFIYFQF